MKIHIYEDELYPYYSISEYPEFHLKELVDIPEEDYKRYLLFQSEFDYWQDYLKAKKS